MEDKETNTFIQEPGVERNIQGRIIATGWLVKHRDLYPQTCVELEGEIQKQIQLERMFIDGGIKVNSALEMGSGKFTLGGISLAPYMSEEIAQRVKKIGEDELVEVCDIGGGNGRLLETVMHNWTSPQSRERGLRNRIRTTMTTLINHEPELLKSRGAAIDKVVVGMGIELPNDDLYRKFDVIAAQNSVFFWTQYPELSLLNMYKMSKPNGVALVTIPRVPVAVKGDRAFNIEEFVWGSDLFTCEQLQERDEDILLKLKRN